MDEAHLILKIAELLGIHALGPLLALAAVATLWRRNQDLQRKLFKLAHAQVLALNKLEATLESTTEALRETQRALRDRDNRERPRGLDS